MKKLYYSPKFTRLEGDATMWPDFVEKAFGLEDNPLAVVIAAPALAAALVANALTFVFLAFAYLG